MRPLTSAERRRLRVELLIPNELAWVDKAYLSVLQQQHDRPFLRAQVTADRPYACYARIDSDGTVVIIDVPTILSSLEQSIRNRRRSVHDITIKADGWEVLEHQELGRFEEKCRRFLKDVLKGNEVSRVRVVRWNGL